MKKSLIMLAVIPFFTLANDNKLADDPTRIVTTVGISFDTDLSSQNITFNGSLALDPARKINVSINDDASEWRIGGSWLFDIGIVNFNAGKNSYDNGASQTNYSVGTFIPLSVFDIEPFGVQIFPMAGYTYNDGEIACETATNPYCIEKNTELNQDYVLLPSTSHSGYLGAFALKPLSPQLTAIGFAGASVGSNDYFGYWAGAGMGYSLSDKHSLSLKGYLVDNPYGSEVLMGASYKYVF